MAAIEAMATIESGLVIDDPHIPQRAAADPTASVWVGASAGTGKTKILTDRVLNLMLAGAPPERILCLTYTKAAAAEMSTRIAGRLAGWAAAPEDRLTRALQDTLGRAPTRDDVALARRLFARVLDTPGGMNIQTIHAFCQSVLGRFPLEAGIAPHFAVADERDAGELLRAARDALLQRVPDDASDPLGGALRAIIPHLHESGFAALIEALAGERRRLQDLLQRHGGVTGAIAAIRGRLGLSSEDTCRSVLERAGAEGAFAAEDLRDAAAALARGKTSDVEAASLLVRWLEAPADARSDLFSDYTRVFLTERDGQPTIRARLATKGVASVTVVATLRREAERVLDIALRLRAVAVADATAALLRLGNALLGEYRTQKLRRAQLDYDDLIHGAARLLAVEAGAAWVLYKLDGGIDHVLIDEAQDTSPEPWQVIRALTAEFFAGRGARDVRRTVFAVGDVKQSIFGFQGADPDAFLANRDWFGARVTDAGENWRPVDLRVSFRSTRAVLAAVDAVFARAEARDGVALDDRPIMHQAFRQRSGGAVELWAPLEPRRDEDAAPWLPPVRRIAGDAAELRLARVIARRIRRMVGGDERLPSAGRPIRPGDIMVLVRRRTRFVEELVRTLKEQGVAVAGVDRIVLSEQIAVADLLAVGHFALLPTDDLTLATVLKSPLIGLDEDQLFALAAGRNGAPLWRVLALRAGDDAAFAAARGWLKAILALADAVPPFEFYTEILGPRGGRRRLIGRLGHDAEDAIGEFLQLALAYERNHLPTLQGFLQWFETGRVQIKRDLEQGAALDAVRILTVHGAKGLEAPIVFLPDTMQVPRPQAPTLLWPAGDAGDEILLWPPRRGFDESVADAERRRRRERELREYRRLLYVAMTRARDRLIVCGWRTARNEPEDCWYRLISDGLAAAGDGLGLETVEDPLLRDDPEYDGDPAVRRIRYPDEPAEPQPVTEAEPPPALPAWARTPPPSEAPPPRPLQPSRPDAAGAAAVAPLTGEGAGLHRGRLIHRLLETLPAVPPTDRANAAAAWLARHGSALAAAERREIARKVVALLDDPALAGLFADGSLAEVPFSGSVGGRPTSGRIDRLVVTPDAVIALDYKTDRLPPDSPARVPAAYLRQVAAYRDALAAIYPDQPIRCLLLWTETMALMPLDAALLDPPALRLVGEA